MRKYKVYFSIPSRTVYSFMTQADSKAHAERIVKENIMLYLDETDPDYDPNIIKKSTLIDVENDYIDTMNVEGVIELKDVV